MSIQKQTTAFDGTRYLGTNALGRPLTRPEEQQLTALLRANDLRGASSIALNFASKKTRNRDDAQDLLVRARIRLVEQGWDPSTVTLAKCLCRFIWSEHTHAVRENATRHKAESGFLREHGLSHSPTAPDDDDESGVPSVADFAIRLESEQQEEAHAKKRAASLRAAFTEANDHINLLWLEYYLSGLEEPGEMARLSNHEPEEFYRAAERRKRHVNRLLAAERGAKFEEDR